VTIIVLLWGTVRSVGRRLMDGIEPELMDRAEAALASTPGVLGVNSLQLRWVGHRLRGSTTIVLADLPLSKSDAIVHDVHHRLSHALPNLDELTVGVTASATVAEPHTHH
jgi:divalent metal cation (Fe/Co/Zn/Cd) transporter